MGSEFEQQREPKETDPGEKQEEPSESNDYENNPDIEDPRLYSPLLVSTSSAHKDRLTEEPVEEEGQLEDDEAGASDENCEGPDDTQEDGCCNNKP